MQTPEPPVQLMYKRPDRDEHEKLTDVLNDIIVRLALIEEKLSQLG